MNSTEQQQIFEKVYADNYNIIMRIAYRMTNSQAIAEELCQEAFVRYFERISSLPDGDQARYWLIRVVKNLGYNYEKRKGRGRKAYERYSQNSEISEENAGEKNILEEETIKIVQKALMQLPYKYRIVLVLKEYENLNYQEISRLLRISQNNVKVRVFRARNQLQRLIERENVYVS